MIRRHRQTESISNIPFPSIGPQVILGLVRKTPSNWAKFRIFHKLRAILSRYALEDGPTDIVLILDGLGTGGTHVDEHKAVHFPVGGCQLTTNFVCEHGTSREPTKYKGALRLCLHQSFRDEPRSSCDSNISGKPCWAAEERRVNAVNRYLRFELRQMDVGGYRARPISYEIERCSSIAWTSLKQGDLDLGGWGVNIRPKNAIEYMSIRLRVIADGLNLFSGIHWLWNFFPGHDRSRLISGGVAGVGASQKLIKYSILNLVEMKASTMHDQLVVIENVDVADD
ncbi:hypothetical protein HG531_007201 [Fusarium graminearum]|nr:hypothetical protein HG531_007201 [Fusarium graminearum]